MSPKRSLRAVGARLLSRLTARVPRAQPALRRAGWIPPEERAHWFGARTIGEASRALATRAGRTLTPTRPLILVVGDDDRLRRSLRRQLQRRGHAYRWVRRMDDLRLTDLEAGMIAAVVAAEVEPGKVTAIARESLADARLATLPFEYVTGLEPQQRQFERQDEYPQDTFISPVLLAQPSPYAIYNASLERFEQKCGLRDYLDLYQMLRAVEERGVPGAVTEFGSYKGHSGWLIGKTLEALGSQRKVYLFDMFESFPEESAGIDYFWSGTHHVDLDEVRRKTADLPAVGLVPGEFERTLPASGVEEIALAYVDCDSYRAVAYLTQEIFESRLSQGGVMVFEDYGHPALLGCRIAVHEFFDGRRDCVRFFSQFSGLYIVVKGDA